MAGLVISRGFERKELVFAQPGNPVGALGYVLTPGPFQGESMQDRNGKLPVEIRYPSGETKTALLGLYWVRGAQGDMQSMRWPSILHALSHDVYLALGDPVTTVWPEPQMLKPGESAPKSDLFALTYEGLERKGTPGKIGTKFLANLRFTYNGSSYNVKPAMTITDSGPSQELLEAGPSFYVSLVGMDAGTKSAAIQVYYKVPFYPMELYYKPLTSLVWIGTGILTLGGLMAAVYRRARPKREDSYAEPPPSVDWADLKDDAPVSAS
jgi:cytochrome c-type biogenesis protein CcmF